MKINVPQNDYVQPTEIREDVVQGIVDTLLDYLKNGFALRVFNDNKGIYLRKEKKRFSCDPKCLDGIRVYGVEMNAAFKALSAAGYYVYGEYNITRLEHSFYWSNKPRHNNDKPMEEALFSVFID